MMRIKKVCSILIFLTLFFTVSSDAAMLRKGKLSDANYDNKADRSLNRPVLPKKGDIAVIVEGSDSQLVAVAEALIIEELVSNGYRVVDEAKMKRIRAAAARAQAARYALEGNIAGILKINGTYNAAATVIARVRAGRPERNEFRLYTGTATAAIIAVTSGGVKLGGKTAQSKAVGYTLDETEYNAVKAVVQDGMSQMF